MEFNQEYYNTVGVTSIGGESVSYGGLISDIVAKMKKDDLDRMDPSNIWCLHYGSHMVGSGGGSGYIAGNTVKNPAGQINIPFEDSKLIYGNRLRTVGIYGNGVAIRWAYIHNTNFTLLGTMDGQIRSEPQQARILTSMCAKNLIAVPIFRSAVFSANGFNSRSITYTEMTELEKKLSSHTQDIESFEVPFLESIKYYYGKPGNRVESQIYPLFESNVENVIYYAEHNYSNINSFKLPPYSYFNGTIVKDNRMELYNGYNINSIGLPSSAIVGTDITSPAINLPAWADPALNLEGIAQYIGDNRYPSFHISTDATCGVGFRMVDNGIANEYFFILPQGARDILNALGIVWAENDESAIGFDSDAASVGAYAVHLGTMDKDGITYLGVTSEGEDIKKCQNFGICEIMSTPYDGKIPLNPGQEVNPDTGQIELNTPGVTPFNTFNHMYCMTQSEVNDFASKIWNADETLWEQIVSGLSLYGEMPINAIISLRMYPIDLLKLFDVASTSIMRIGKTAITLDSQTEFVTKQKTAVVNMGSCVFPARYNNFLDYEPYTKAMLYLPYCGTVDVATADVVGKTVQVYYIIDVMTGGCTAVVYFGGIPYFYKNGRVGVEIPITANADSAVTSDALSLVTGGASSLLAAATGNPVAAALSLPSMVNSGLQLAKDSRSSFQTTGTQTPTAAQWTPQNAYFIVQRSVPDEPAGYGHSVGYVTLEGGTLGSFTGYTVMSNPDLSGVDCTEGEKEMIRNLLESGIYC